jgi:hypothetical protein
MQNAIQNGDEYIADYPDMTMWLLAADSPSVGRPEPPRSITGRNAQRPVGGSGTGRGRGRGREGSGARDNAPQAVVAAWEAEMMEVVMRSLRGNGRVNCCT